MQAVALRTFTACAGGKRWHRPKAAWTNLSQYLAMERWTMPIKLLASWPYHERRTAGFARLVRRTFDRDRLGNRSIERLRVNLAVEVGDFEVDLILEVDQIQLPRLRIDDRDFLALLEANAGLAERGRDARGGR
jgi:hypothetical protein